MESKENFGLLTINKTLSNKLALGIDILYLLRCYILTLCQLEDVLFPVKRGWRKVLRLEFL